MNTFFLVRLVIPLACFAAIAAALYERNIYSEVYQ